MTPHQMQCLNSACGLRWDSLRGEVDGCPKCGHLYVQWLNFEKWSTPCLRVNGVRIPYQDGWARRK